jgi:hypothetical protein
MIFEKQEKYIIDFFPCFDEKIFKEEKLQKWQYEKVKNE